MWTLILFSKTNCNHLRVVHRAEDPMLKDFEVLAELMVEDELAGVTALELRLLEGLVISLMPRHLP